MCTKQHSLIAASLITLLSLATTASAAIFDGQADNERDDLGYYYTVTGSKFVNGQTADGTANGRTIRLITDDPAWGQPMNAWQKDGFFSDTAGVALTMKNGASTVYDNNGLEDGSFAANNYNAQAGGYPVDGHGAVVLYSMSNNYDFIYAGYFKINEPTVVTSLTGYFVSNEAGDNGTVDFGFDPSNAELAYRMNIFSSLPGLDPNTREVTNTLSFTGDVFSTDLASGSFAFSDTGYDRVGSSGLVSSIHRLTFTPDVPLALVPGEYFFSHDATIVPEPSGAGVLVLGGMLLAARHRRRPSSARVA